MAAQWQNPPDADIILRASGGKELHAHKLVLSLASPVFKDMFSVPQPLEGSPQTPIVDVDDPPEVLEMFLQIIYPIQNPPINDVETLTSLLLLADKYDAKGVLDAHKNYVLSICINPSPIHMYVIHCAYGHEKEAEAAARRVSFASLASLPTHLFRLMTIEHYQRLVRFMATRDQRMRQIVNKHQKEIARGGPPWCDDSAHNLYSGIVAATIQAGLEVDPCVRVAEALGLVLSAPLTFPPCRTDCRYNARRLHKYTERLIEELAEMAEGLPWVD